MTLAGGRGTCADPLSMISPVLVSAMTKPVVPPSRASAMKSWISGRGTGRGGGGQWGGRSVGRGDCVGAPAKAMDALDDKRPINAARRVSRTVMRLPCHDPIRPYLGSRCSMRERAGDLRNTMQGPHDGLERSMRGGLIVQFGRSWPF